jgi:hypothetical protein
LRKSVFVVFAVKIIREGAAYLSESINLKFNGVSQVYASAICESNFMKNSPHESTQLQFISSNFARILQSSQGTTFNSSKNVSGKFKIKSRNLFNDHFGALEERASHSDPRHLRPQKWCAINVNFKAKTSKPE